MRVVIKVGTSSLVSDHGTIALGTLASLVETVCRLRELGHAVVLVSSGAVGCGCIRMGLSARPSATSKRQALAAVGQMRLMRHYDDMFAAMGVCCAQVLLTYDNLNDRAQFVNARSTLDELLQYGAVPIVNENDTVAVEELRFGDNDTLSAKVAAMLGARHLFLLTDVDAVYTRNPAQNPDARRIAHVARSEAPALLAAQEEQESEQEPVAGSTTEASGGGSGGGGGSGWGTGGMEAKIRAAVLAAAAGAECVICSARDPAAILRLLHGSDEGTRFAPAPRHQRGRKRWIIGLPCRGA